MTIYDHNNLRAELLDGEAVTVYLRGTLMLEVTLQEWRDINLALEGRESF